MRTVPLSEIADVVSGATPKTGVPGFWGGEIQWATPADLGRLDGGSIARTPRTLTRAGLDSCGARLLPAGSVLLSSRAPIGHLAINAMPMATNQGFKSLVPNHRVDARYLYHYLASRVEYLQSLGNGATFKELSKRTVEQIEIPLPAVDEQRRIAAILDQADALRAKRCQVLAHLDALTQAIFHDMFDAVDGSDSLAALVTEFRYGTSNKSSEFGYPTLRIPNVMGGSLNLDEIKTVQVSDAELARLRLVRGDLLFVRSNGNPDNVGRCAVFDPLLTGVSSWSMDSWIYASYLIRARLDQSTKPEFLNAYFASSAGRQQLRERSKTSAGQYNINIDGLSSIRVPSVPLARQELFATRIAGIAVRRAQVDRSLRLGDALVPSLQHRAFRGEL